MPDEEPLTGGNVAGRVVRVGATPWPASARLPALITAHTRGMYDLLVRGGVTGEQPRARLFAEGHADRWGPAADYIERHEPAWTAALSGDGGPAGAQHP